MPGVVAPFDPHCTPLVNTKSDHYQLPSKYVVSQLRISIFNVQKQKGLVKNKISGKNTGKLLQKYSSYEKNVHCYP